MAQLTEPELDERIEVALAMFGYTLGNKNGSQKADLSPEELITEIISKETYHGIYFLGIPTVLDHTDIDYKKLCTMAVEKGLQQKLGYALDFAKKSFEKEGITYGGMDKLNEAITRLQTYSITDEGYLTIAKSEEYRRVIRERAKKAGLNKWGVLGNTNINKGGRNLRMYHERP